MCAKQQVDTWLSFRTYTTLGGTCTLLIVVMEYASFWWILVYLDPWTFHLLPGLPAAALAVLQHTSLCAMYAVPFCYTIVQQRSPTSSSRPAASP